MSYRKLPIVIEATQWFTNGDHPLDGDAELEGNIVRYFRRPDVDGESLHLPEDGECACYWNDHGWIDTLEGDHTVCPGDWIITGVTGEFYPCKPEIFELTYEWVE